MTTTMLRVALGVALLVGAGSAQAQQTIRVGISPTPGALTVYDEKTGRASGATGELLEIIAKNAGWKLQYVQVMGSGTNPYVAAFGADKIDVVAYAYQITPDRTAQFDFSEPILSYGEALVVHKSDARQYQSAADLKGVSLGVIAGSNYVDIAKRVGADAQISTSLPGAVADVNSGKIAAAMGSAPTIIYEAMKAEYPNVRIVTTYKSDDVLPAGFGVKKGNAALLSALNAGLAKLRADGTLKTVLAKYSL
jgi:polar amino acid transport system substrate-binding protein